MWIARLGFLLCALGYVTAICQPNWQSCKSHEDCCSTMCLTHLGQCSPKRGDQW
ncbi:uncharacterized protein Dyak_GE29254 [Drosophila yakuba]|uniref:Uncharacterized protein n=1 Tax=Drosophila yakuba TaxID=7245 RepID=A0A0R1E1L3_DROYA|nr:uncharacterized protein LOC120452378 [Drosophila santomea]KRK03165.1 uncharacterized protein Dyak_GE29254 [Drosophila yakuba]